MIIYPESALFGLAQRASQIAVTPPPFGQYYLQSHVHPRSELAIRGVNFATQHGNCGAPTSRADETRFPA